MAKKTEKTSSGPAKTTKVAKTTNTARVVESVEAIETMPAPSGEATPAAAPTYEEIQKQAYYVAERRMANGLPGDHASDWIEAEKELSSPK